MFMQPNQPQQPIQPIYTQSAIQPTGGGWSKKQKIIMLSTGVFVVIMLLIMLLTAIFSSSQSPTQVTLTTVDARNTGILALIDQFESNLRTASSQSFTSQAKILIASDNLSISDYLAKQYSGASSKKQMAELNFTNIASELEKATTQSDFDQVFVDTIKYEIDNNKKLLENIASESLNDVLEPIVTTSIDNDSSLLD